MSSKTDVLSILENVRGEFLSGKEMAVRLGVSRNTVWKAVRQLKDEGHLIEAVTNKGYRLKNESDVLSVEGMEPFLDDKSRAKLYVYRELPSTNKTAKELAENKDTESGTVVMADMQTEGAGRRGRSFYSPQGGIYASFIFRPEALFVNDAQLFTLSAAVAACEAVEEVTGKKAGIKWINDLVIDGRKVCGILTESVLDMENLQLKWVVTGIGINFCLNKKDLPPDIRETAGSIYQQDDVKCSRNRLAAVLINKMRSAGNGMDRDEIISRYRQRLTGLGSEINVLCGNEGYTATAMDIDDTGCLIVKKEDGSLITLNAGEISIRPVR